MLDAPSDFDSRDVLIIGASARAAATSAARAGWRAWAVDLFGDDDLKETAVQYRKIAGYHELPRTISDWPKMPWLAGGALENHPRLIARLSEGRPYWGNPAEVIRQVRGPQRLAQSLVNAGLSALKIWPEKTPPPTDGRWMLKPRRSAGGRGIFVWDDGTVLSSGVLTTLGERHFFQERVEGEAVSALFLSEANQISLIGVSRLLMADVPGARFGYGGAIGPVPVSGELETEIKEAGRAIGESFLLRGLWGTDFVHDGSRVWATEVNPRYTATVELYEMAFGTALLAFHRRACEQWRPPAAGNIAWGRMPWQDPESKTPCVGKVVIYADRELPVPPWGEWPEARDSLLPELPTLADRPGPGSIVSGGFPLCSLLAAGVTERDCRAALNRRLKAFHVHFMDAGVPLSIPWVPVS